MRSMTGFGVARRDLPGGQLTVQVAAVNHRHLQVHLRGDLGDLALEELVREAVRARCTRGHVTAQVSTARDAGADWDAGALAATWKTLATQAAELGAPPPRLEALLVPARRAGSGPAVDRELLAGAAAEAIEALEAMRLKEGAHLAAVLDALLAELDGVVAAIAAAAAERLPAWKERLVARVREAVGEWGEADEAAVLRECAIQADKGDVAEELARLQSHREQFAGHLVPAGTEAVGRTLEFLLQEMNREVNTIGSKANDAELAQLAVKAKSLLEQMREQVANIL